MTRFPPTALKPVLQRGLKIFGPVGAVIVAEHDIVLGEVGRKRDSFGDFTRLIAGLQIGGNGNGEAAPVLEHLFHPRGRRAPVMVILPVDDDDADLIRVGGGGNRPGQCNNRAS